MSGVMGVTVAVRDLHDVPQARRAAADTARNAGMCSLDVSIIALVASELATNLARYAPGGTLSSEATGQCVYLESRDAGPGIGRAAEALVDGFSTGSGLGVGLGTMKRMMDGFSLETSPAGTTIKVHKCCAHGTQ
jgi:anti-sigma regulatory factor (Ser/Thr protein kinase)